MPPRYAYWTIIAGGLPTAFRTAERDEILPTFKRIQEKHPDAELKYFARGRLWNSQEDAKRAAEERREGRTDRPPRAKDWRPGGSHRDPRQPFQDAKKARNLRWRKERFERRQQGDGPGGRPPSEGQRPPRQDSHPPRQDSRPPRQDNRPPWRDSRPPREKPRFDRDQRPPREDQRLQKDTRPPRENQRFRKDTRPPRENQRFGKDTRPPRENQRFDRDRRPLGKDQRFGRNDRPPREKPHGDPLRREVRPEFKKKSFDKPRGPGGPPRGPGRRPGRPPGKPPRRRS
jgi:hypothetical protein